VAKKPKPLQFSHFDITSCLLGVCLLVVVLFNWKNLFLSLRVSIIIFSIVSILLHKKFIDISKKFLGFFGGIIVIIFPVIINIILFLLFDKFKIRFDYHWFVLIWLMGIIPLAYHYASKIVAILSFGLFMTWSIMIFNLDITVFDIRLFAGTILKLLLLLCFCGLTFGLAELINRKQQLKIIGRIWKILSIIVGSIVLLALTIDIFDNFNFFDIGVYAYNAFYAHGLFLVLFFLVTLGLLLYNFIYKSIVTEKFDFENFIAFLLVSMPINAYILIDNYFVTHPPYYYTLVYDQSIWLLFNSIFIGFALILLIYGFFYKIRWLWQFSFVIVFLFILSKCFSDYLLILKI